QDPSAYPAIPDISTAILQLDLLGALKWSMLGVVFTFLFTDMFDSISTFLGVAQVADLTDEQGQPKNLRQALLVDAVSTTASGLFGSSSGTTYIESAAGVEEGGRTGLTAVTVGLLFLPFLFLAPVVAMVPAVATAPALVLVGFYMMGAVKQVEFGRLDEGVPAFLALILIPLTYSITQGISWSFVFYVLLKIVRGEARAVPPMLYLVTGLGVLALILS
ncbi:MAG: NCS2 family permease, partial [Myxococcota bacterium]|nr:NCS2 family permease [Myxococcota bacterium]